MARELIIILHETSTFLARIIPDDNNGLVVPRVGETILLRQSIKGGWEDCPHEVVEVVYPTTFAGKDNLNDQRLRPLDPEIRVRSTS